MPIIVDGYRPEFSKIFLFFETLIGTVDWEDEQKCLGAVAKSLAVFYALQSSREKTEGLAHSIEHRIFDLIRSSFFVPPKTSEGPKTLATLPQLYKIFERC